MLERAWEACLLTPEIWSLQGEIKADAIELSDQIPITTHEGIGISQFEIRNQVTAGTYSTIMISLPLIFNHSMFFLCSSRYFALVS